jgi:hypothetical protein
MLFERYNIPHHSLPDGDGSIMTKDPPFWRCLGRQAPRLEP